MKYFGSHTFGLNMSNYLTPQLKLGNIPQLFEIDVAKNI